jgi:hypothetical protein
MNIWKIGSGFAVVAACASALALGQGCVVSIVDPGPSDGGSGVDGFVPDPIDASKKDTGTTADSGPARTCEACQRAECITELTTCQTPLANKSNVITLGTDPYVNKTFCTAYLTESNKCQQSSTTAAELNTCLAAPKLAYPEGIAGTDAIIKCIVAKCNDECVK